MGYIPTSLCALLDTVSATPLLEGRKWVKLIGREDCRATGEVQPELHCLQMLLFKPGKAHLKGADRLNSCRGLPAALPCAVPERFVRIGGLHAPLLLNHLCSIGSIGCRILGRRGLQVRLKTALY